MARSRRLTQSVSEVVEDDRSGLQWIEDGPNHVKELSDRVTELSTLMGISTLLSSDRPLAQVLDSVCRVSAEICRAQVAFIHLVDGDEDLVCVARYAPADHLQSAWEGIARIYSRRAIQKGSTISSPSLLLRGEVDPNGRDGHRMGGICTVPLNGRARTVGAIVVGYSGSHRFSAREKDMLSAVAAQLAMAVERSWLFDRLQEQLARANSLREVATRINSNLELDAVLDSIVNHASRLLATEFSAIFLVDEPQNGMPQTEGLGRQRDRVRGAVVQLEGGSLGNAVQQAVETGRPAVAHGSLPGQGAGPVDEVTSGDYQSALAVPLLSGQEVLGALVLCYQERRRFDASDISLAEDFAGQAALAIRNARIYEEAMENRLSLEAALNQINNHGISLLDRELNIKYANPAAFWMVGSSPRTVEMSLEEWSALLKKSLVEGSELDQALERIRVSPEETVEAKLTVRNFSDTPRTLRLLSLPLRQGDGTINGRVNLLEEGN